MRQICGADRTAPVSVVTRALDGVVSLPLYVPVFPITIGATFDAARDFEGLQCRFVAT